ncbi:hypothetical protein N7519_001262 [Penicillium mononematosum]|uniref:uncharacterized protein n=1 Tax=Penicillium mononematosum TaxID=268346 RepID=UPI0025477E8B|nr:uncharacterized protein N7519_001262 [Penicillium mononematosum]KAJ6191241.1 hypothetical protein N7519_001262 [Penicillium mononematosum]
MARGVKKETRTCYFCKQRGHLRAKCPAALAVIGLVHLCRVDGTLTESFEPPAARSYHQAPAGQNVLPRANAGRGAANNVARPGNASPAAGQAAPGPANVAPGPAHAGRKALTRRNLAWSTEDGHSSSARLCSACSSHMVR